MTLTISCAATDLQLLRSSKPAGEPGVMFPKEPPVVLTKEEKEAVAYEKATD